MSVFSKQAQARYVKGRHSTAIEYDTNKIDSIVSFVLNKGDKQMIDVTEKQSWFVEWLSFACPLVWLFILVVLLFPVLVVTKPQFRNRVIASIIWCLSWVKLDLRFATFLARAQNLHLQCSRRNFSIAYLTFAKISFLVFYGALILYALQTF
jgi:positive regulator of sigma E activity